MKRREFHIRPATVADAEGILECLATAFAPYRTQYTPAGFADTVLSNATICERLREMALLVAVDDAGKIIGTIGGKAATADGEGHIRGMAVLPAWQGKGVAAELLARVEQELRHRGCNIITLDTTQPLQRAIAFYTRNGYAATGRISDFFGMPLYEYAKHMGAKMSVVNLAEKFAKFSDHWSPKIIGELNDSYVKAVKLKGEFVWHHHDNEDELFLVTRGTLRMKFRDREEVIRPGEFIIVPRGVEHLPVADEETCVVLLEPKSTLNTGNVQNERTRANLDRV